MEAYFKSLCIFVCLTDFLAHLLASEKYFSLYKNVSGIFIVLLLVIPISRSVVEDANVMNGALMEQFQSNISNSEQIWQFNYEEQNEKSMRLLEYYVNKMKEAKSDE